VIPFFVLPFELLVVLASLTYGDKLFLLPPHKDWGRAGTAGNCFARDDKEPGPQLGEKQLPGERLRETAET
jgi:hypothetical protein